MAYRKLMTLMWLLSFFYTLYGNDEASSSQSVQNVATEKLLGQLNDLCAGKQYFDRQFELKTQPKASLSKWYDQVINNYDGPSIIAKSISYDQAKLVFLQGGIGSGKTVALRQIEYKLYKNNQKSQTVFVDGSTIFSSKLDSKTPIKLKDLIERSLTVESVQYITDTLEKPSLQNVYFLFDDIDKVPREQVLPIISIVRDLKKKGVRIVMSGRNDIMSLLPSRTKALTHYVIPAMKTPSVKLYLETIWKSSLRLTTSNELRRVEQYANLVASELGKSQFPQTPLTLGKLADMLIGRKRQIFGGENSEYGISCRRYVRSSTLTLAQLQRSMQHARLDVMYLYNEIIEDFSRTLTPALRTDVYGPYALKMLDESHSPDVHNDPWAKELTTALKKADDIISLHGVESIDFMHFPESSQKPTSFIEPMIQSFYAADFLVEHLKKSEIPLEVARKVFVDPAYDRVLEIINSVFYREILEPSSYQKQMETNLKRIMGVDMSESPYILTEIMDNVIRHGFDSIGTKILEMSPPKFVKAFIESNAQLDLYSKYIFGMLTTESKLEINPTNSPTYSRREILMKMNMDRSLKFINWGLPHDGPQVTYDRQLEMAVTHWPIDQEWLEHTLGTSPPKKLHPDYLNRFVFKAINNLGDGCQPIVRRLVEFGAKPLNYKTTDGHTLVHVALKWSSLDLLRFVVEDLHVPVDDAALKAAFSKNNRQSVLPEWKKMVSYMVEKNFEHNNLLNSIRTSNKDVNVYVSRKFKLKMTSPPSEWPATREDGATTILSDIVSPLKSRLITIEGNVGSGKTRTLTQIAQELKKLPSNRWDIIIDLSRLFSNTPNKIPKLTLMALFQASDTPANKINSLKSFQRRNPNQMSVLLDNFDRVPRDQLNDLFEIIKAINEKGTAVVIASRNDLTDVVTHHELTSKNYLIDDLTPSEMRLYMTNLLGSNIENPDNRVQEYVEFVCSNLEDTPFPRNPLALKRLGKMLTKHNQPMTSCQEYVHSTALSPAHLALSFQAVRFDVSILYDKIATAEDIYVYGPYALKMLLNPLDNELEIPELQTPLEMADKQISEGGVENFDLMRFPTGSSTPSEFVDPVHRYYFAAEYLLNYLDENMIPKEIMRKILIGPEHYRVLEFMNAQLVKVDESSEFWRKIAETTVPIVSNKDWSKVMDNLVAHGFNGWCRLFSTRMMELGDPYLTGKDRLELKFEYKLGLLTELKGEATARPTYNRREMIIKMQMKKSLKLTDQHFLVSTNQIDNLQGLLRAVATTWPIEKPLFELLAKAIPKDQCTPEFLNEVLFDLSETVGPMDYSIAKRLIKLGAQPQSIERNGQSLISAALRWRSIVYIYYIVDILRVKIDDRALASLFNDNAYPYTASTEWREMLLYLVEDKTSRNKQKVIGLSELNELCSGKQYFNRQFRHSQLPDDTIAIAKELVSPTKLTALGNYPFIIIQGGIGSGKSVTLTKIQYEMQQLAPSIWIERIDLLTFNFNSIKEKFSFTTFIETIIPPEKITAFSQILGMRPPGMIFIFDHLDQVPNVHKEYILGAISHLYATGVGVLISSRKDLTELLSRRGMHTTRYFIDEMTTAETASYLKHIWKSQLSLTTSEHLARLEEYATELSSELELTPFPRNPYTLEKLADALTTRSGLQIFEDSFSQMGEDCVAYLHDPKLESYHLKRRSQTERLDLIMLYDRIIKYSPKLDRALAIEVYGPYAVRMTLESENSRMEQWRDEWTESLIKAEQHIERGGIESFDLMNFQDFRPTGFIEPVHQKYFAAKYLLKRLAETEIPLESLRKVFKDPAQRHVLELINSGFRKKDQFSSSQWDQMTKNLLKVVHADAAIMDNLLVHGFDVLSYRILKMNGLTFTTDLLHENVQLRTQSQYAFRMLRQDTAIDTTSQMSRREMLTNMNMKRSIKFVNDLSIPFGEHEDLSRYLKMVATHWPVDQDLFNTIMEAMLKDKPQPEILNEVLFESIDKVGADALPIANRLVQLGADPQKSVVNGRTLTNVAVKWHNRDLLRAIVDDFNVPLDKADAVEVAKLVPPSAPKHWDKHFSYLINIDNAISDQNRVNKVLLDQQCAAGKYLSRKFEQQLQTDVTSDDGPTTIAKEIIHHRESSLLTTIEGTRGSGKTVSLKKIQHVLQNDVYQSWTVYVDLSSSNLYEALQSEVKLDSFMEKVLPTGEGEFFAYLLQKKPESINLLLDNWDRVPQARSNEMLSIIKYLNTKRVAVVMSGRHPFTALSGIKLTPYGILDMPMIEMVPFMTQIWDYSLKPMNSEQSIRMKEYATYVSLELEKTSFPRNPYSLQKLASLLTDEKKKIFGPKSENGITCTEYVYSELQPLELYHKLQAAQLDSMFLYETITSTPDNSIHSDVYGPYALKMMIQADKSGTNELESSLHNADDMITRYGTRSFNLMDFSESMKTPLGFIEPTSQTYFAADYLLEDLARSEIPLKLLTQIFIDPAHHQVLQFMNSGIRNVLSEDGIAESRKRITDNLGRIINENGKFKIMDNLVIHGLDDLASTILRSAESWSSSYILGDDLLPLKSEFALGMLAEKTGVEGDKLTRLRRRAMLIKMNMKESWSIINQQVPLCDSDDLNMLLHITATTRPINLEAFETITHHMIDKTPPMQTEFLNRVLFETIDKVGDGCQEIATRLKELGAQPQECTMNGRTLVDAAVQWSSENLLRFVVEDLKVPIVTAPQSFKRRVWSSALDANSFPHVTPSGWWKMVKYLVDNDLYFIPNYEEVRRLSQTKIPTTDLQKKFFALIYPGKVDSEPGRSAVQSRISIDLQHEAVNAEELLLLADQIRFTTASSLDLTPETLALRRSVVLQKCYGLLDTVKSFMQRVMQYLRNKLFRRKPSLPEVLAHYRGVEKLSTLERREYEACIESSLEKFVFHPQKQEQILKTLIANAIEFKDIEFITETVIPKFQNGDTTISERMRIMIDDRMKQHQKFSRTTKPTLATGVLQSVEKFYEKPLMHNMNSHELERYYDIFTGQRPASRNMDSNNEASSSIQACLGPRRRRALSSIACSQLREDVDRLNDADSGAKRGIINSDKLLKILPLSFSERSRQFIRYLRMIPQRMMTGNYQLVTEEIIESGSFPEYYKHQRSTDAMSDLPAPQAKQRFLAIIPKQIRTRIGHGANGLMLLRALQGTVMSCTQEHNGSHTDCIIASTALTINVVLDPLSRLSAKYTPKILHQMGETALNILPYIAPKMLINFAKVFHNLDVMANAISHTFKFAGIATVGFDVYNVVQQSTAINRCSQDGAHCISRDKNSAIISLTFSCLSIILMGVMLVSGIGFVAGALIGLTLMVIEMVAQAVNNVVYYHNNYKTTTSEEFRLFWHSMVMADPPSDVTALAERTDTIHSLNEYVIRNLGKSPETVVAYGVGIGIEDKGNMPWRGSINMEQSSMENTEGLSRVQPGMKDNTIRLCLPKWNRHEEYDKWNETVPTAVFRCKNAFVIADAQRWKKRNKNSYINFDLGNINQGIIVGSSTLNNMFQISGSRSQLTIVGGSKKLVNIYVVQDTAFHGTILLSTESQQNILDLSTRNNNFTSFFNWDHQLNLGMVKFNSPSDDAFYLNTEGRQSFNLHIIGREKISDVISCQSGPDNSMPQYGPIITADGGGGESMINMDILTGCKASKIRPFTQIISPDGQKTTYATELSLESAAEPSGKTVDAIVRPKQSHYSISFTNRPLFSSIFNLQYNPGERSLVWKLHYIDSTVMLLSILPYYTVHLLPNGTASGRYSVTCVFNDNFFNATIFPIIENPRDSNETIDVRVFNVFTPVNSSVLSDVVDHYHQMMSMVDDKWNVVMRLTDSATNSSFIFGSNLNDSFYIDNQLEFVSGGNGPDIYTLTSESPDRIWIENEADDDALDTLMILDNVCSSIDARSGSVATPGFDNSEFDVTLICSSSKSFINIFLRNYYLDQRHQHLQILWGGGIYQLPSSEGARSRGEKIVLIRTIFVNKTLSVVPAKILTSKHNYIFNITGSISPFVAYRELGTHDLILVEREMDIQKSLFLQLIDFFSTGENNKMSFRWLQNEITLTSDNGTYLAKYSANNILNVFINSEATNEHGTQELIYHEYSINMTDPNNKEPFSAVRSDDFFISGHEDAGIIKVIGADPREFNASWDTSGTNSSCLLKLCISSKNCCHSFSRVIFRIEFIRPPYQSIAIPMHQLTCDDGGNQSHSKDQSNKRLSDEFIYAQTQLEMPSLFNNSDMSRLRRCIGSLYADKLSHSFMYKLFGFSSIISQINFMQSYCEKLFRRKDLIMDISQGEMHDILLKLLDNYFIRATDHFYSQDSILQLRQNLDKFDNQKWRNFIMYYTV